MRILLLSEIFPPKTGGSGRWFHEIYRRLPDDLCRVAAGEHGRAADFDHKEQLSIVRLPLSMPEWGLRSRRGLRDYWKLFKRLRRIVIDNRITMIHCGRCLPEGWLAWLLKKVCGIPYLCYVHGEDVESAGESRELSWMVRRVLSGADGLIANSQFTGDRLTQRWNVADEHLTVLNPGVDSNRFVPAPPSAAVRAKLEWTDRTVILTVGRLQQRKGQDVMIQSLKMIREAVPNILYSIIGDGEQRAELERLAKQQGVLDCIQFCGEVDDSTMVASYQQCDLFALPNRQIGGDVEGFGMVLVEAQSCGRPVLAGASGGTKETMIPGETGVVIDCQKPDRLGEDVIGLLLDPLRLDDMGQRGRKWVTENLDWTPLSRKAMSLFGVTPTDADPESRDAEVSVAKHA